RGRNPRRRHAQCHQPRAGAGQHPCAAGRDQPPVAPLTTRHRAACALPTLHDRSPPPPRAATDLNLKDPNMPTSFIRRTTALCTSLIAAGLLAACASKAPNTALEQARSAVSAVAGDPVVNQYAPVELKD